METSKASSVPAPALTSLLELMRRHPLIAYFVLAFAFSWILTIPHVLSVWNVISGDYSLGFSLKQKVGPAMVGVLMTLVTLGKPGLPGLRQRIRHWRVGWRWYLFILLGIPALALLGIMIQPGALANYQGLTPRILVDYPVYFAGILFATGLPEEIGWRGFALPRMQARFGPLWSSLLLGSLWAFWHLPSFLLPAHGGGPGASYTAVFTNFVIFFGMVVALTILFTWVFNHTQGSILIASLLHTAIDAPQRVWAPLFLEVGAANSTAGEMKLNLAYLIVFGMLAITILLLTRGRLGCQPVQEQAIYNSLTTGAAGGNDSDAEKIKNAPPQANAV